MKRVVITGIGAVTPLGNSINRIWENLTEKKSGIGLITRFNSSAFPSRIAGELKHFCPENYIPRKDILRFDPFIHYAAAAAIMAAEDAGLISFNSSLVTPVKGRGPNGVKPRGGLAAFRGTLRRHSSLDSAGIFIGSSRGGITSMENSMERHFLEGRPVSAYLMSSSTINMASANISIRLGVRGPAIGISTACASGANAIGEAARLIRYGEIKLALAGGAEAPICKLAVGGYGSAGALSKRNNEPDKASRPFDKDRDGFVLSEGAGIVILEELESALRRGAGVYAEVAGYGVCSDAFHQTRPDSKGEAVAIKKAIDDAKISVDEVDYINAHAASTVLGDIAEAQAIKEVFGSRAYDIPVSSYKSMLGHMLGGAGAVEVIITALSISKEIIIPTINLENPDPDCELNHVTSMKNKKINIALSNSFGFGGVNAVLALRKIKI